MRRFAGIGVQMRLGGRAHRIPLPSLVALVLLLSACHRAPTSLPGVAAPEGSSVTATASADTGPVLPPVAAGTFYPADPTALRDAVALMLAEAPLLGIRPIGLVAPHAGYVYSGPVAAAAYRQAQGGDYDVVVVVGTNHAHAGFDRVAVHPSGALATPLGELAVDAELAARLIAASERIVAQPSIFEDEHSVATHLPFIQHVLPGTALVPIVMGAPTEENVDALANALVAALADRRPLLVASTDLSHYPSHADAIAVDGAVLAAIETLDPDRVRAVISEQMARGVPNLDTCACGEGAVLAVLQAAVGLGADKAQVVTYRNSGDTPMGEPEEVVGYGAVAFFRSDAAAAPGAGTPDIAPGDEPSNTGEEELTAVATSTDKPANPSAGAASAPSDAPGRASGAALTSDERAALLALARSTIDQFLRTRTVPAVDPPEPALREVRGAFVTLTQDGQLRGCMGSLVGRRPLYLQVQSSALMAATQDPRFRPVTAAEVASLEIEISALGPLERVTAMSQIEVGRHGLLIEQGNRSGTLLPQVPGEHGWDRDEFLVELCRKAGLPDNAWQSADLYRYTAEVFHE